MKRTKNFAKHLDKRKTPRPESNFFEAEYILVFLFMSGETHMRIVYQVQENPSLFVFDEKSANWTRKHKRSLKNRKFNRGETQIPQTAACIASVLSRYIKIFNTEMSYTNKITGPIKAVMY